MTIRSTHPRDAVVACRCQFDEPAGGAWNMAVDEALLEAADADGVSTLRFYRWSEPTLSLGYFQRFEDRGAHCASRECPVVRRASGGGAILHDAELTYSLALPTADRLAAAARGLHDQIQAALAEALAALDVQVRICAALPGPQDSPFLCFQRRGPGDLLLGNWKIAGSAQRRHRGAILQHGSILLATSNFAPELPGLMELTGKQLDLGELANIFRGSLGIRLKLCFNEPANSPSILADELSKRAHQISREKFAGDAWTSRR